MIIEHLTIENFRNFAEKELYLHPQFNLIVGVNGTGKTALLDALSVSIATWLIGFKSKLDSKGINKFDARLTSIKSASDTRYESVWPVRIEAYGSVLDSSSISWTRSKHSEKGNTRYSESRELLELSQGADSLVRSNGDVTLPLIGHYGTMRLWSSPRARNKVTSPEKISRKENLSRLEGYRFSVDPRISVKTIIRRFTRQAWLDFQRHAKRHEKSPFSGLVENAVVGCVEGASDLSFDVERGELMLTMDVEGRSDTQPFDNLSDGMRSMTALVMDIAQKAMFLNPELGQDVLQQTPGIVLIDELDLHLHPRWQRNLIENLRQTFPKIQFICTTHSPFLIQSLRSGDELIMLDGLPTAQLVNKPIEDIAKGIMGVENPQVEEIARVIMGIGNPQVAERYKEMKDVARNYLELLEEAEGSPEEKLEQYKQRLASSIAPYADNPAYQAILEMEQIAKIGA